MITSNNNPKLRYVQHMARRSFRAREGRMLLEGVRLVEEAMAAGHAPAFVLIDAGLDRTERGATLHRELEKDGVPIFELTPPLLRSVAGTEHPQGIMAVVPNPDLPLPETPTLLLLLDGLRDPGNLGGILRTADAAGVDAVVVPRHGAAGLGPTVSKVAAGAAESLPFASVGNLSRVLGWLQDYGVAVLGTSDRASQTIYEAELDRPLALVMGSEHTGLGKRIEGLCDELISLPMQGSVSSLNVSVATGIFLYEINRQRLASAAGEG